MILPKTARLIDEAFEAGGFAVICIDPTPPGARGLPDSVGERVVLAQLATPPERHVRYDVGILLPYALGDGTEPRIALIPWGRIFCLIRRDHRGTAAVQVNAPGIPRWLGEGDDATRALGQLLAGEGLVPPELAPGGLPWGFEATLDVGAPAPADPPDKRQALLRLLDDDGADRVVVLIDGGAADLVMPRVIPGPMEVTLPGRRHLGGPIVTGLHVGLDVYLGDEKPTRMRIPWSAISAMQDPTTRAGWFWPADLPESIAQGLADRAPEAWSRLLECEALPLPPLQRPEAVWLAAPVGGDKRVALEGCLRVGPSIMLVAAHHPSLRTLPGLAGRPLIACVSAPGTPGLTLEPTGVGVRVAVRDAYGNCHQLRVPWDAVCAIGTNQGGLEVHAWPESYPPEVTAALERVLAERAGDSSGVPAEGVELAEGLTLTRNDDGRAQLELHQPLGPAEDGEGGLTIDAAFVLPLS